MNDRTFCVVGDKFIDICKCSHINAITYTQLINLIFTDKNYLKACYTMGQGLSREETGNLQSMGILFNGQMEYPANKRTVHKHKDENVLITNPKKRRPNEFIAKLRVDDNCAEMRDHVTGVHISGNILIEAARQMTIACIEKYCINTAYRFSSRFVWNDFSVKFMKFIFPVDVFMVATLRNYGDEKKHTWQGTFRISYYQNGEVGAEITITMSTYEEQWLKDIEYVNAAKVCHKVIREIFQAA